MQGCSVDTASAVRQPHCRRPDVSQDMRSAFAEEGPLDGLDHTAQRAGSTEPWRVADRRSAGHRYGAGRKPCRCFWAGWLSCRPVRNRSLAPSPCLKRFNDFTRKACVASSTNPSMTIRATAASSPAGPTPSSPGLIVSWSGASSRPMPRVVDLLVGSPLPNAWRHHVMPQG